jgi:repressor LexA
VSEPLSALERSIWLYLIDFLAEHTYQPSIREIATQFNLKSTKTVVGLLESLESKGYITRESSRARGITLIGVAAATQTVPVPCYLRLADARPALRDENRDGYMTFDRRFVPNADVFVLLASAESVRGARSVEEGDFIMVDPSSPANDGALVVARVASDTIVRTIEHRGATTLLMSQNREEPEIPLTPTSDFEIVGIVVGLLRAGTQTKRGSGARLRGRFPRRSQF